MTLDEYAQWAATIAKPGASRNERLTYLALALIGEVGEACDNIKNLIRDGKHDEDYLVYELGDLIYYWTCLCAELGQAPSDMLAKSRTNIEARLAERAADIARHRG
jgi:NTP pyrophosphatase (non-canonical NTP hydrolase)